MRGTAPRTLSWGLLTCAILSSAPPRATAFALAPGFARVRREASARALLAGPHPAERTSRRGSSPVGPMSASPGGDRAAAEGGEGGGSGGGGGVEPSADHAQGGTGVGAEDVSPRVAAAAAQPPRKKGEIRAGKKGEQNPIPRGWSRRTPAQPLTAAAPDATPASGTREQAPAAGRAKPPPTC